VTVTDEFIVSKHKTPAAYAQSIWNAGVGSAFAPLHDLIGPPEREAELQVLSAQPGA
jgi:hypothetical protein